MPVQGNLTPRQPFTPAPGVRLPSWSDTTIAAFQLENATVNILDGIERKIPAEPDFNVLEHLNDSDPPEHAAARSSAELARMREQTERERSNRRTLSEAGTAGTFLSMFASVLDPVALAAGGPAGRAAWMAAKGASPVVRGVVAGSAGAVADTALQEGALQATQQERTAEQSLAAIGASLFLGGAIGGPLGALAGREARAGLAEGIESVSRDVARDAAGDTSVGAARYRVFDPEDLKIAPTGTGIERVLGSKLSSNLMAPGIRAAQTPFDTAREAFWRLADLGVRTVGDMAGRARPQGAQTHVRARTDFEQARRKKAEKILYAARTEPGMSKTEFWSEVSKANRAGDIHPDPSIQDAALWWRKNVYDPPKVEAQRLGMLADELEVLGAKGYAPRDYAFNKLSREPLQFQNAVSGWLQTTRGLGKEDADELAEFLYSGLLASPDGRLPQVQLPPGKVSAMKERTFNVPDDVLEPWLEQDARVLGDRYARTMLSDIEMAESFGGLTPQKWLGDQLARLRDELADRNAKATPEEADALSKRAKEDADTMRVLFDRVRGTDIRDLDPRYLGTRLAPAFRTIGNITPTQMLGTVVVSSLTDAANLIFQHGLTRVAGTALRQFGVGFSGLRGVAKEELQQAGALLETVTQSRRQSLFDAGTSDRTSGPKETASRAFNDLFFRVTMLNQWTDGMSGLAALLSTQRILDAAEALAKGRKPSEFDLRQLAAAGLDEAMLRRIAAEAKNWQKIPGGRMANIDAWGDREAARMLRGAVAHGSDMAIMRPNAASVPFWVGSAGSKLIYQFKSFASTMVARTLVSGLQRQDMAAMNGVLMMTALGVAVTSIKDLLNYGEIQERSTAVWVTEAIDRSGVVQPIFELNSMIAGPLGFGFLPTTSRYATREDIVLQFLGPAASQGERIQRLSQSLLAQLLGEELTQGDVNNFMRLMPFANLHGARAAFEQWSGVENLPERRG